jgi:transcriptional regulator with XRE-family HTH domain
MKLGDVLRKEREKKGLSAGEVASRLGIPPAEYELMEAGESEAEQWGPVLAWIAIALETPTSRLLAESGRAADTREGQAGELIRRHRERRRQTADQLTEAVARGLAEVHVDLPREEYETIEAGRSPIETVGPRLLAFAEAVEQPVFNLFYPCGLPFQELDDYP